jgi:hypothetical protein
MAFQNITGAKLRYAYYLCILVGDDDHLTSELRDMNGFVQGRYITFE